MRASSFRVRTAVPLLAAVVLFSCSPEVVPPSPSPSPVASTSPAAASSPSPTSSTTGSLVEVLPGLRTAAIGTIPRDFVYARVTSNGVEHVYLLDLSGVREPVEIAQREAVDSMFSGLVPIAAVTPDGGLLILDSGRYPEATQRFYSIRPATGEATLLLDSPRVFGPIVSPDGRWFAFSRMSPSGDSNGVWVAPIAGGAPRLLANEDPGDYGGLPTAMFWASERLVGVRAPLREGASSIAVIDVNAAPQTFDPASATFSGSARVLGSGCLGVDPSRGERDLLCWRSRGPFGDQTVVSAFDSTSGQLRELYRPGDEVGLKSARWHPDGTSVATVEGLFPAGGVTSVWVRRSDGVATRQLEDNDLVAAWWSRDGGRLFAELFTARASSIRIDNLTDHRTVVNICRQGVGSACAAVAPTPSPTPKPTPAPLSGVIGWRAFGGAEACGTVRSYVASTATTAGSLVIGSRTFPVAPGYGHGATGFSPTSGKDQCLFGGLGDPLGTGSGTWPLSAYDCGYVVDQPSAERLTLLESRDQGLVTFAVSSSADIGTVSRTHLRCFDLTVDPMTGDAQIVRRTGISAEEVGCGMVKRYVPPTVYDAGSVSLGSRTFVIRAGVDYSGDPAGLRTDPVRPGVALCLKGVVEDDETLSTHGPDRLLPISGTSAECGNVMTYRPPTASAAGEVRLFVGESAKIIPIGVDVGDDAPTYRCYDLGLDARGDLVVTRRTDRLPQVVTSTPWPTHAP